MLRRGVPRVCRAVAGLEGCSQAALQRNACIRKVFASSLAAVRRRSVCAQLKLQAVSAETGAGLCVAPPGWGCCAAAQGEHRKETSRKADYMHTLLCCWLILLSMLALRAGCAPASCCSRCNGVLGLPADPAASFVHVLAPPSPVES